MPKFSNDLLSKTEELKRLKLENKLLTDDLWQQYMIDNTKSKTYDEYAYSDEEKLQILNGQYIVGTHPPYYKEELLGVKYCYNFLRNLLYKQNLQLNINLISDIQQKLFPFSTRYADMVRGKYRTDTVYVEGKEMLDYRLIRKKLMQLLKWFYESDVPYFEKLSCFYLEFVDIHPFFDGNGRTSRAIINLLLAQDNLPFISLINPKPDEFYDLFTLDKNEKIKKLSIMIEKKVTENIDKEISMYKI